MKLFQPSVKSELWCNKCDSHIVDSERPVTGSFFIQHGSKLKTTEKGIEIDYTTYTHVVFALCHLCK